MLVKQNITIPRGGLRSIVKADLHTEVIVADQKDLSFVSINMEEILWHPISNRLGSLEKGLDY